MKNLLKKLKALIKKQKPSTIIRWFFFGTILLMVKVEGNQMTTVMLSLLTIWLEILYFKYGDIKRDQ